MKQFLFNTGDRVTFARRGEQYTGTVASRGVNFMTRGIEYNVDCESDGKVETWLGVPEWALSSESPGMENQEKE